MKWIRYLFSLALVAWAIWFVLPEPVARTIQGLAILALSLVFWFWDAISKLEERMK